MWKAKCVVCIDLLPTNDNRIFYWKRKIINTDVNDHKLISILHICIFTLHNLPPIDTVFFIHFFFLCCKNEWIGCTQIFSSSSSASSYFSIQITTICLNSVLECVMCAIWTRYSFASASRCQIDGVKKETHKNVCVAVKLCDEQNWIMKNHSIPIKYSKQWKFIRRIDSTARSVSSTEMDE